MYFAALGVQWALRLLLNEDVVYVARCSTYKQPQPRGIPCSPSLSGSRADTRRGLRRLPWNSFFKPRGFFQALTSPNVAVSALPPPARLQSDPRRKVEPEAGVGVRVRRLAGGSELLVLI